jgi:hypothetical protein
MVLAVLADFSAEYQVGRALYGLCVRRKPAPKPAPSVILIFAIPARKPVPTFREAL